MTGLLVYCLLFLAWIIYLIIVAPYRVGVDPWFAQAYRFVWARWHPGKWWYTLAEMGTAISLNLVGIFTQNGYLQLYLGLSVVIFHFVVLLLLKPWRFAASDHVDSIVKITLMLLCILATLYVSKQPSEEEKQLRVQFLNLLLAIAVFPLIVAVGYLGKVLWSK